MYKVVTKFEGRKPLEVELNNYSDAFTVAENLKKLVEDKAVVSIETDIRGNKFNNHILNRFTRRD